MQYYFLQVANGPNIENPYSEKSLMTIGIKALQFKNKSRWKSQVSLSEKAGF